MSAIRPSRLRQPYLRPSRTVRNVFNSVVKGLTGDSRSYLAAASIPETNRQ